MTLKTITIDTYKTPMATALSASYLTVYPHRPGMAASLDAHLRAILHLEGYVWVILANGKPVGMASVAPLPGLPGMFELDGFIAPQWQRQGLGSQLLRRVMDELPGTAVHQISHAVTDIHSPAAQFLQHHHFAISNEEWLLVKQDLADCEPPAHPDLTWGTLSRVQAVAKFCELYDRSFKSLPWYQPYTTHEVAAELTAARDLLFLRRGAEFIGFAWLRWPEKTVGQIEPIGIVAGEQRKGYGRYLLAAALHQFAQRGAKRAQIGAWATNQTAIRLYESMGFRHQETVTYLAYDLPVSIVNRK